MVSSLEEILYVIRVVVVTGDLSDYNHLSL